ncbi:alpha-tocopherol transfer protein-like isoform X1 [Stomoxys calcitrans]|uniref:alpha-tocopherol transfer protein-like isoform X1 n=1 Tax=Stomoxys calcitrans TaxID=35570 RepID=UPI0027E35CA9|nr:alpha-tocopherol transfer protein-like isoform X1 [Stomoxys calcitrans]
MEFIGDSDQEKIIDDLQKWFEENDKLPKKINRLLLTRFYYCMFKDVEETKNLIEINYAMRQRAPTIFITRDPTDEDTQNSAAYADMVLLPGMTPDNCRVSLLYINNPDPKMMHHAQDIKAYFMVTDYRFSMPDMITSEGKALLAEGEIKIIDMKHFTLKHIPRLSIWALRTTIKYLQEAYPVRIKSIHIVNCPPYMNKIIAIVRPFISQRVFELIHFHTDDLERLYDHVPRQMLVEEHGGQAGKISDYKEELIQSVTDKREYLMDLDYWKV